MRPTLSLLAGTLLFLLSGAAEAQYTPPAGTPAEGVDVQYRYTNPSQSQQMLAPQVSGQGAAPVEGPGARGMDNRFQNALDGRGGAAGGDDQGMGGEEPFISDAVIGVAMASGAGMGGAIAFAGQDIYRGVIPGLHDSLPHIARYQARAEDGRRNSLTWIGFQPFEMSTRVFLQTGRPAQYRVQESPDGLTLTVLLRDTQIPLSNFRRDIDASYFGRAVGHVHAQRGSDGNAEVVIALSRASAYTVTAEGEYLYIDFED